MNINPMDFLKDLKNIQNKMTDMQDKLKDITVSGSAGGDMVIVEMNCEFKVIKVKIMQDAVNQDDIEMLEDLVQAAISSAIHNVKEKIKENTSALTGGLNIPMDFFGK